MLWIAMVLFIACLLLAIAAVMATIGESQYGDAMYLFRDVADDIRYWYRNTQSDLLLLSIKLEHLRNKLPSFHLPRIRLPKPNLTALRIALARAIAPSQFPVAVATATVVARPLPAIPQPREIGTETTSNADMAIVRVVRHAIENRYGMTIRYTNNNGETSTRAILPHYLTYDRTHDEYDIVAYCNKRKEKRVFRADRVVWAKQRGRKVGKAVYQRFAQPGSGLDVVPVGTIVRVQL
jgi:hypothetical protein